MGSKFDVPILVPRRRDDGPRDTIWNGIQSQFWYDANVFEGFHETDGPFNRSAAINAAAALAGDWDVAVIADSDSILARQSTLFAATALAMKTKQLVIPHSRWVNVEQDEADDVVRTSNPVIRWKKGRTIWACTLSSILIVPRSVWDTVNGFDERFVGWGWEDTAFMHAVDVLTPGHIRLEGDVYHLAHDRPHADVNRSLDPGYIANSNHYRNLYKRANDPTQLRRVIAKNRVTL